MSTLSRSFQSTRLGCWLSKWLKYVCLLQMALCILVFDTLQERGLHQACACRTRAARENKHKHLSMQPSDNSRLGFGQFIRGTHCSNSRHLQSKFVGQCNSSRPWGILINRSIPETIIHRCQRARGRGGYRQAVQSQFACHRSLLTGTSRNNLNAENLTRPT